MSLLVIWLAARFRGSIRSVIVMLGVSLIVACGGDGDGGMEDDDSCSRYSGEIQHYFYPRSGRINSAIFSVTSRYGDGAWLTALREYDDFDDGSVDSTTRYSYFRRDSSGNLIRYRAEWDDGANGSVDEVAVGTYTRNSAGQRLTLLEEIDLNTDGIYDIAIKSFYIYDGNGHSFRERIEIDDGYDGMVDELFTFDYSFDANGNFSSSIRSHDIDNDGVIDGTRQESYSFIFDSQDRQIGFEVLMDDGVDGSIEKIENFSYRFEAYDCDKTTRRPSREVPRNGVNGFS